MLYVWPMGERIFFTFVAAILAFPALASDIEIVISRSENHATLYVRGSLALVPQVFGADLLEQGALANTPCVNASDLFSKTLITTPSASVQFEQLTALAHPSRDPKLFGAPWDASSATSDCSTVNSDELVTAATHDLYASYIARNIDALSEIRFIFPAQTSSLISLTIRDFAMDQIVNEIAIDLAEARVLVLPSAVQSPLFRGIFFASLVGFLISLGLLYAQRYRQQRSSAAEAE